jgi:hypothetical protein
VQANAVATWSPKTGLVRAQIVILQPRCRHAVVPTVTLSGQAGHRLHCV